MKPNSKSDQHNISGSEQSLLETHMNTMKYQLRIKLLRSLLNQKLVTRDIFFFARKQADRRLFKKVPDWDTMERAMLVKMSDVKSALKESYINRMKAR